MRMKVYRLSVYKRAILVIVVAAAVLYSLKLKAKPDPKPRRPFAKAFVDKIQQPSHRTHLRFIERCDDCNKDCTDCHALNKETDAYRLNRDFCHKCHLPSPPPAWKIPIKARKMKGISFSHAVHERRRDGVEITCRDCHESTIEDDQTKNQPLVAPERCFSCHADRRVGFSKRSCGRCHQEKRKNRVQPSTHDKKWRETHGEYTRWNVDSAHGEACALCHQNAACVACHRNERPRNHTGLWRVRMHGTAAMWDRDRCKTCHETGACISCHRRSPPVTHRGNWVSNHGRVAGFEDRCTVCHNSSWCTNCHRGNSR